MRNRVLGRDIMVRAKEIVDTTRVTVGTSAYVLELMNHATKEQEGHNVEKFKIYEIKSRKRSKRRTRKSKRQRYECVEKYVGWKGVHLVTKFTRIGRFQIHRSSEEALQRALEKHGWLRFDADLRIS